MSSIIANTSFATFKQAAAAHTIPRSMHRSDMPFTGTDVELAKEKETGFEAMDKAFYLVADRSITGRDAAKVYLDRFDIKVPDQETAKEEGEGEDNDEDDGEAEAEAEKVEDVLDSSKRDIIVWLPRGDSEPFVEMNALDKHRVMVIVCDDKVTEVNIVDLAAALTRSIVTPFAAMGTRVAWKEARRPSLTAQSDLEPGEKEFDVPVQRRISSIVDSANKRLQTMYETVFDRKILTASRSAVCRWAKKEHLPFPPPIKKKEKNDDKASSSK